MKRKKLPNVCFRVERSRDKELVRLKITTKTGVSFAFLYSQIQEVCYRSSNKLEIFLPNKEIIISGNNLEDVYNAFCQHRLIEIIENMSEFIPNDESNPLVTDIKIGELNKY